ncbi:MAG: hypothetical protein ACLS76_07690, partial [Eubacterium callanderi]
MMIKTTTAPPEAKAEASAFPAAARALAAVAVTLIASFAAWTLIFAVASEALAAILADCCAAFADAFDAALAARA